MSEVGVVSEYIARRLEVRMLRAVLWADRRGPDAIGEVGDARRYWRERFTAVRGETERRAAPLSAEDQVVQSMPEASPTKWHRAHTTWFFEQFLLAPHARGYRVYDPHFAYLFNSYYVAFGPRHARPNRGLVTRPTVAQIAAYRAHVDAAVTELIEAATPAELETVVGLVEIGLNHEQQHQELLLTDILHAFAQNPCAPVYALAGPRPQLEPNPQDLHRADRGHPYGRRRRQGFSFDNERPAHRTLVGPVRVARGLVSNGDERHFMADGGYRRPELWLSDGWATLEAEGGRHRVIGAKAMARCWR